MWETPGPSEIANAAILVGLLFVLRYFLAMRRIWRVAGRPHGLVFGDYFRAVRKGAYGPDLEPERRHAVRQFYAAFLCLAVGLLTFAYIFAMGLLAASTA